MKQILPSNAKISKEAKETMQECVSEFISFVTGEASDKCHKEKRKTVNGDDICWALATLGYREQEGERAGHKSSNSEEKQDSMVDYNGEQSRKFTAPIQLKFPEVFDRSENSSVCRRF
ncbi:ccaat-binding transcription factor subunit A, putative [Ricinus communis]|uniref:Ccaat-binding transcription factor subunit A, putative n=1 Tax=Ricinus communis TaxID=3988 RepID=B9T0U2_RICCO|nr:ccaat-binding transcription factor subunit A, putative [Ricinus communis]